MSITLRLLAFVLLFSLTACSGGGSNSRLDYKEVKSLGGLDVPPDLVAPENTGETELPTLGGGNTVLPQVETVRIARDGIERWLVLDAPVEELWPRLRSFWSTLGLELVLDKPELGVMETAWAENRADAPGGFLANMVKKLFKNAYAAGTRDKYRLRLERGEGGGSEIFISHYGLKEVVVATRDELEVDNTRWEVRPSDHELVYEVMNRLVLFLGGSEQTAAQIKLAAETASERARIEGEMLVISEGFARSWRRTGIALDSLGLVVEDRNRAQGIYYIGQIELLAQEEKGWLSSLFASKGENKSEQPQLQIVLRGDENLTHLSILNMDGSPRRDKLAGDMLKRLHEELK
ncbi:MAG: outer membrane protein assembly factor BamC [Pseudomonadota bacterium]